MRKPKTSIFNLIINALFNIVKWKAQSSLTKFHKISGDV